MSRARITPSQTVGPFFHMRLGGAGGSALVEPGSQGAIRIEGRVLDGEGAPVDDALLELWQADAEGRIVHPDDRWPPVGGAFTGFGRATTDRAGAFAFETVKPGRVRARDGSLAAPHASLVVFARGLLRHLHTRIYFADEAAANARDPVIDRVPAERRPTLIASGGPRLFRFDVVLQGPNETVFFEV